MMAKLAAIVIALASSTCCPSLFLSVQKGKPAPRTAMPEPEIAIPAIPTPPYLRNRFFNKPVADTARNTQRRVDQESDLYAAYTDSPTTREQLVRALNSLEQLEDKFGVPRAERLTLEDPGSTRCSFKARLGCDEDGYCNKVKKTDVTVCDLSDISRKYTIVEISFDKGSSSGASYWRLVGDEASPSAPGHEPYCWYDSSREAPAGCLLKLQGEIHRDRDTPVTVKMIYSNDDPPRLSQTLLSFVHTSDMQIRDRDILLGSEELSKKLDWLIEQSFEYDRDLTFNNLYVAEALFATINKEIECAGRECERSSARRGPDLPAAGGAAAGEAGIAAGSAGAPSSSPDPRPAGSRNKESPAFVIHTGDAIDAGLMSEAEIFHGLIDRLNTPVFNALGNHDVMVFGNLMPTSDHHGDAECGTVASVGRAKARWLQTMPVGKKLCVDARVRCNGDNCKGERTPVLIVPGQNNEPVTHANARAHFIQVFGHEPGVEVKMPEFYQWNRDSFHDLQIESEAQDQRMAQRVRSRDEVIDGEIRRVEQLIMEPGIIEDEQQAIEGALDRLDQIMAELDSRSGQRETSEAKRQRIKQLKDRLSRIPVAVTYGPPQGDARSPANDTAATMDPAVAVEPDDAARAAQESAQAAAEQEDRRLGLQARREASSAKRRRCSALVHVQKSPWLHGFASDPKDFEYPGYYAFPTQLAALEGEAAPRNLISVVLDTLDLKEHDAGVTGRIQTTQMNWLKSVLECAGPKDLIIVFGHNPISSIETDVKGGLESVLKAHRNVIAYLFGHDHNHQICRDHGENRGEVCTQFWEVQTASLLEFPQEARRVKIKYAGKGMAFLELVAFQENLRNPYSRLGHAVALARTAAQRDRCRTDADARCSPDERVYRTDGDDANARLWFTLP